MRIAQLSSMTGWYGGEVHLSALAGGLRALGHEVWGVVRPGSALADRLPAAGVPVRTLPLVDWYEPVGTLRLRAWLRREHIDVLHAHVPRDWYTAAVAGLGTGTVLVGTRHRLEPLGHPGLKRPFVQRFAALLAVSEAVRAGLLAGGFLPPGRVVTVANGLPAAAAAAGRSRARDRLGVPPGVPLVGFVGRVCAEKGVADLVEAAVRLRQQWPRLQVVVIGGEDRDVRYGADLRRRIAAAGLQGCVRLLGYRADAADLCAGFDVQAVPSRAEPFGLVVLEALARGVPVVATRAGGIPEILRDERDGLLVAPGDPAALAAAVGALLADPARRARCAARGRNRVRQEFSLERMVLQTEAVYRRALRAQAPRLSPASVPRPATRHR